MQEVKVEWKRSVETARILEEIFDSKDIVDKYTSKVGKILEEIMVYTKQHMWSLFKSHAQIEAFIGAFNNKYQCNLRQGSFMLKDLGEIVGNAKYFQSQLLKEFLQFDEFPVKKVKSVSMLKRCGGRYNDKCYCKFNWLQWKVRKFVLVAEGILYYSSRTITQEMESLPALAHQSSGYPSTEDSKNIESNPSATQLKYPSTEQLSMSKMTKGVKLAQSRRKAVMLLDSYVKEYFPFDSEFQLTYGFDVGRQFGILIKSNHRKLQLQAQNIDDFWQFIYFIKTLLKGNKTQHRFKAFAPVRLYNSVHFLIDGKQYFHEVAFALERAKSEIFIAGWWVSPEFNLVRPIKEGGINYRLDYVLERAAQRNVKICIIVYNESSFLTNDSKHTKTRLQGLHHNIKVLQHPLSVLPTLWSHHEKCIVIDQSEAFLGGLDLCYGRWDNSQHLMHLPLIMSNEYYPGIEYNNIRINDLINVADYSVDSVDRKLPRLPWHDVAVFLRGQAVRDICHHFIQYWNYASFQAHHQERYILIKRNQQKPENTLDEVLAKIKRPFDKIKEYAHKIVNKINATPGRAYQDDDANSRPDPDPIMPLKKMRSMSSERESNQFDKEQPPTAKIKSYSHIHQPPAAMTKSYSHFPSDNESNLENNLKLRKSSVVIADSGTQLTQKPNDGNKQISSAKFKMPNLAVTKQKEQQAQMAHLDLIIQDISQFTEGIKYLNQMPPTMMDLDAFHSQLPLRMSYENRLFQQEQCQVLRSASNWAIGCSPLRKEQSIHEAYCHLIMSAKKFIYIENQFFISSKPKSDAVKNSIANCLYQRIKQAILAEEEFKVYVILPLIPGFAGELNNENAVLPRVIMHWQYETIVRGPNSLLGRLQALTKNPSEYINFYGLRTHQITEDTPTTEIIYLHSKLMIVDDRHAIIGSANINDRSMRGSRDSQLCLAVSRGRQVQKTIGGVATLVSEKIHAFRVKLFCEHFNLAKEVIEDPVIADNFKLFQQVAKVFRKGQILLKAFENCGTSEYFLGTELVLEVTEEFQGIIYQNQLKNQLFFFFFEYSSDVSSSQSNLLNHPHLYQQQKNTKFYRKLFGCYPDDTIQSLSQIDQFRRKPTKEEYGEALNEVTGNIVEFPLHFLNEQDLLIGSSLYPTNVST